MEATMGDGTALFHMVDRAAPFMDAGTDPSKWPPSAKLKIAYSIMATGRSGAREAELWLLSMLDRARALWVAGLHPDPWAEHGGER
jgi:hypothetical protein